MSAQILRGSKQEIAEKILELPGDIHEVIVIVEEPTAVFTEPGEDIFADMAPYEAHAGGADCSRETIYTRMEGE
jgi:predicted sugar kinase